MTRPPRRSKDRMITLPLMVQIGCTAGIIVTGTLYVFWKEVCKHRLCNRDWKQLIVIVDFATAHPSCDFC